MPLAAHALISVVTAKSMIKLLGVADDTIIETYINGVSKLFENYCNTKFIDIAVTDILDGSGTDKLLLENPPARTITEIKFDFDTSAPTLMALADFSLNGKAGILRMKGDSTFTDGYGVFPEGFQNIQVKYTSGYGAAIANLPEDIILAAVLQVEFLYKRDTADFSTTLGEGFVMKVDPKDFAPGVRALLDTYKRMAL
jgi:hypothetical protein